MDDKMDFLETLMSTDDLESPDLSQQMSQEAVVLLPPNLAMASDPIPTPGPTLPSLFFKCAFCDDGKASNDTEFLDHLKSLHQDQLDVGEADKTDLTTCFVKVGQFRSRDVFKCKMCNIIDPVDSIRTHVVKRHFFSNKKRKRKEESNLERQDPTAKKKKTTAQDLDEENVEEVDVKLNGNNAFVLLTRLSKTDLSGKKRPGKKANRRKPQVTIDKKKKTIVIKSENPETWSSDNESSSVSSPRKKTKITANSRNRAIKKPQRFLDFPFNEMDMKPVKMEMEETNDYAGFDSDVPTSSDDEEFKMKTKKSGSKKKNLMKRKKTVRMNSDDYLALSGDDENSQQLWKCAICSWQTDKSVDVLKSHGKIHNFDVPVDTKAKRVNITKECFAIKAGTLTNSGSSLWWCQLCASFMKVEDRISIFEHYDQHHLNNVERAVLGHLRCCFCDFTIQGEFVDLLVHFTRSHHKQKLEVKEENKVSLPGFLKIGRSADLSHTHRDNILACTLCLPDELYAVRDYRCGKRHLDSKHEMVQEKESCSVECLFCGWRDGKATSLAALENHCEMAHPKLLEELTRLFSRETLDTEQAYCRIGRSADQSVLMCKLCRVLELNAENMGAHLKLRHAPPDMFEIPLEDYTKYVCPVCKVECEVFSLVQHCKEHHPTRTEDNRKLERKSFCIGEPVVKKRSQNNKVANQITQCTLCDEFWVGDDWVHTHHKNIHSNLVTKKTLPLRKSQYACNLCDWVDEDCLKTDLNKHVEENHSQLLKDTEEEIIRVARKQRTNPGKVLIEDAIWYCKVCENSNYKPTAHLESETHISARKFGCKDKVNLQAKLLSKIEEIHMSRIDQGMTCKFCPWTMMGDCKNLDLHLKQKHKQILANLDRMPVNKKLLCSDMHWYHVGERHYEGESQEPIYKCQLCGYLSQRESVMKSHQKKFHFANRTVGTVKKKRPRPRPTFPGLECLYCDWTHEDQTNTRKLQSHFVDAHSDIIAEEKRIEPVDEIKCVPIGRQSRKNNSSHREKLYACLDCNFTHVRPDKCKLHTETDHSIEAREERIGMDLKVKCDKCPREFIDRPELLSHFKSEHFVELEGEPLKGNAFMFDAGDSGDLFTKMGTDRGKSKPSVNWCIPCNVSMGKMTSKHSARKHFLSTVGFKCTFCNWECLVHDVSKIIEHYNTCEQRAEAAGKENGNQTTDQFFDKIGLVPNQLREMVECHKCKFCNHVSVVSSALRKIHVTNQHPETLLERGLKFPGPILTCKFCSFVTTNSAELSRHLDNSHEEDLTLKCYFKCNFKTKQSVEFEEHIRTVHDMKCNLCGVQNQTLYQLKNHLAFHAKIRESQCEICGLEMHRTSVRNHMWIVHKVSKTGIIICELCGKEFGVPVLLKAHMRTEHKNNTNDQKRVFKCNICNLVLGSEREMKIHRREMHLPDYFCTSCTFKGKELGSLLDHFTGNHVGKIGCAYCSFSAARTSRIISHTKTRHPGQSPFRCETCNFESSTTHEIANHQTVAHDNPFNIHSQHLNAIAELKSKYSFGRCAVPTPEEREAYEKINKVHQLLL